MQSERVFYGQQISAIRGTPDTDASFAISSISSSVSGSKYQDAATVALETEFEDCELAVTTMRIQAIKNLMISLKDILIDTNIIFDAEGIKIINMDKTETILVHMHLLANRFEYYKCNREKIVIGINMTHLFMFISTIDATDTLTISIPKHFYEDGVVTHLRLTCKSKINSEIREIDMKLIEPETEELSYPDVTYSSILNLKSAHLQKIVRDASRVSDRIEISFVGGQIIVKYDGPIGKVTLYKSENPRGDDTNHVAARASATANAANNSKIAQGIFSLKYLGYFIKCTPLCADIEVYLENDLPIIVKYDVMGLGEIRLCLSQL